MIVSLLCLFSITILVTLLQLLKLYYDYSNKLLGDIYLAPIMIWLLLLLLQIIVYNKLILVYCFHH